MGSEPLFKRIVLKISGEAMQSSRNGPVDETAIDRISNEIRRARELGVEIALVTGGGNFFRGMAGTLQGINRNTGDYVGMLATLMNTIILRDGLERNDIPCIVQSALEIRGVIPAANIRTANTALKEGKTVLFAGGTGHPYFTTDTTASLRACEIGADAVLKATKVDGIYSADPMQDKTARRYDELTFTEAISKRLAVMDSTAFSMCQDNDIPIVVFNFLEDEGLKRVLEGDKSIATFVGHLN